MLNPLFIIGNPRSGTSLLRLVLTCHENICIPPECHFFLWLEEKYGNWTKQSNLDAYLSDLAVSRKFETWGISISELKSFIQKNEPSNYSELTYLVYVFYGVKIGKKEIKVWGDKNTLWKEKLSRIPVYFPEARYIHIIRDGRDVACSFMELHNSSFNSKYAPNLPSKIEDIALDWKNNISLINKFLNSVPGANHIIVKYEDLILNFHETVVGMLNFLNLNYDPNIDNYYKINLRLKLEPEATMEWKTKLNDKPDPLNVEKYKNILTGIQIEQFNKICAVELDTYGYKM